MIPELPSADQTFEVSDVHLDIALAQVSIGFWEVDLVNENHMLCTRQCKQNFGWDVATAFSYDDMLSCILPEDLPEMQAMVMHAIAHQQPYAAQYRVKHPDGSVHWIEANGKVLYDDGTPHRILGTTIDITEKKDLETLRDELLNVSMHELKTPLSAVRVSLQLLERHLRSSGDEKILDIASRALGSTDRITRLLSDMASPLNAQSRDINLVKTNFDIRRLADEIADNAKAIHDNCDIKVFADADETLVYADRYRIAQVITNLVNNGIKYSAHQPKLEIHIQSGTGQVNFRVRDHGVGITLEDRKKVFQKFYRANTDPSVDGLGIGLHLCAEVILRHGGSIQVEDLEQPGTTVLFTVPSTEVGKM